MNVYFASPVNRRYSSIAPDSAIQLDTIYIFWDWLQRFVTDTESACRRIHPLLNALLAQPIL